MCWVRWSVMARLKLCQFVWKWDKIRVSERRLFLNSVSVGCALWFVSSRAEVHTPQRRETHASAALQYERPERASHHCACAVDRERWLQRTEQLCLRALHRPTAGARGQWERSDRASHGLQRASSTVSASGQDGILYRVEGKERSQQIPSARADTR